MSLSSCWCKAVLYGKIMMSRGGFWMKNRVIQTESGVCSKTVIVSLKYLKQNPLMKYLAERINLSSSIKCNSQPFKIYFCLYHPCTWRISEINFIFNSIAYSTPNQEPNSSCHQCINLSIFIILTLWYCLPIIILTVLKEYDLPITCLIGANGHGLYISAISLIVLLSHWDLSIFRDANKFGKNKTWKWIITSSCLSMKTIPRSGSGSVLL